jgi:hypothetical protein
VRKLSRLLVLLQHLLLFVVQIVHPILDAVRGGRQLKTSLWISKEMSLTKRIRGNGKINFFSKYSRG